MRYSKGICWVDDTRIPFVDEVDLDNACNKNHQQGKYNTDFFESYYKRNGSDTKGRFTPSLLVCDDMLNDGSVSKSQKTNGVNIGRFPNTIKTGVKYQKEYERGFDDKGTNSRYYDLDKWFDKVINEIR